MTTLARIELELVDPARNAKRFYAMTLTFDPQLTLFPGLEALLLVVARGRLGNKPIVRRERFVDLEPLGARWRELVARRRQHGYAVTCEEPKL
jgi:predicted DNA-binding WGR domain protein